MTYSKATKTDPYKAFNYRVQITSPKLGNIECGFSSITGLGVTANFEEYREGGNNGIPDKFIEYFTANSVVMSRGMTQNDAIYDLVELYFKSSKGLRGSFENRFDVKVEVMNYTNTAPVKSFQLIDCVIENFGLGDFNSMTSEYAIEGLTIQFNALKKTL